MPIRKTNHPYAPVWDTYMDLYNKKFGTIACVNYRACSGIIKQRLENHSIKGLVKMIEMFFEEETGTDTIFDLKAMLSAFFINKYSPKLRLDPKLYSNAEEWNKEVY